MLLWKGLAIGIVLLFHICIVPSINGASGVRIGEDSLNIHVIIKNQDLPCYPVFNGTKCEGGWFISTVNTSFVYDNQIVNEIYCQINNEQFFLYEEPFIIDEEGYIQFSWYWIDLNGTTSNQYCIGFKSDHSPPASNIIIPEEGGFYFFTKMIWEGGNTVTIGRTTFVVAAGDEYSGVDKVTFSLTKTGSTIPETYEANVEPFIWNLKGNHLGTYILSIKAYDNGGLFSTRTLDLKIFYFGLF